MAEIVKRSSTPTRAEIVQAARNLVPVLKERAQRTEDARMLPAETVADLRAAGIHKLYTPKRYGGFEMPCGVHVDASRMLGQGCGATGWVSSVVFTHTFLFGRFESEAQEEIWGENPDAIISTGFAGGGKLEPVEGGYIASGRWKFCSGIDHANAVLVGAKLPNSKAAFIDRWIVLKPSDFQIVDTWHAEGLRGTGSKDIKVENAFIPSHRTLDAQQMANDPPGAKVNAYWLYGVEFHSYFVTLLAGPILGAARGALNEYIAQTRGRTGAMTGESIVDQVPVQVALAESILELDTADMLADRMCEILQREGEAGRPIVGEPKLKIRRDLAMIAKLAKSSADRLSGMMGVTAQTGHNPVQRFYRDVRTMSTHSAFNWHQTLAQSGKFHLGLKTGDARIDDWLPQDHAEAAE